MIRFGVAAIVLAVVSCSSFPADDPPPEAFRVFDKPPQPGPQITPLLQFQTEEAWRQDEQRQSVLEKIRDETELLKLQKQLHDKLLNMIGGLPSEKTDLRPQITGSLQLKGFSIEKLVFQSLPGVYVTALVYVPDDHSKKHPAVLVPAGHAADGKFHYQALSQRLVGRGYVVISWDPVGQGERSQFWDAKAGRSRYNLICAEHAVIGNLAYLAGANLARWEVWDGMRAVDYLLTRPDVDPERISITGTSGGGFQTAFIAALDTRIKVVIPSCYITALPMRMYNRIFADPDSDPEQDTFGMISEGVDHPGLLLLMYPRPVMVAAAVLDFFPIEGTHKTVRELRSIYERFGHADRIAITEGYHKHEYSAHNQEAALDFLDRFNGEPPRRGLPAVEEQSAETCTRTGQVMLEYGDAKSLIDVIREYYEEHKNGARHTLATEYYGPRYPDIKNWKLTEFHDAPRQQGEIAWQFVGRSTADEIAIDRYLLRHSGHLEMPLLLVHAKQSEPRNVLLWFSDQGKATVEDWPEIKRHIAEGYDVVSFDFRGLGETRMQYTAVSPDDPLLASLDFDRAYGNSLSGVLANYVYNSLLIGRPYFLQMIEDAEIAGRFASDKLGTKAVAVTAPGDAYTVASAIAETLPGLRLLPQTNAKVLKWSELVETKQENWPIQLVLPSGAYIH